MVSLFQIFKLIFQFQSPIASFRLVAKVQALPRTRSGKTMRKALADFARNKTVNLPATIEDPSVFIDIRRAMNELGYANSAPSPLLGYKKRD
jgi:propionyl-CoA synthetase